MKLITFILFFSIVSVSANVLSQTRISMGLENVTLRQAFDELEKQTGFKFFYLDEQIDGLQLVSLSLNNQTVEEAIFQMFGQEQIKYKIFDNQLVVLSRIEKTSEKQAVKIKGTITDAVTGEPLIGVNIIYEGTSIGVTTDADGKYNIEIPSTTGILVFSYIGYNTERIDISGRTSIDLQLASDITNLDEVVVIGYGTAKKSDLTGSIAVIKQDDYKEQPVNRIDQILQGRISGVNVTNSSGAPGGLYSIRIRGANSINGNNDPLVVVDGFVGGDLRTINPSDIESIQILKDASSTAIYGSRGANGVILITTKSGVRGKQNLSFSTRFSTSKVLNTYDLMDAGTFAEVNNERTTAMGTSNAYTQEQIDYYKQNGGSDWQDEILRTGTGMEYQMDYSGGNDAVKYFISGNYMDQAGIVINSDYKRYSLRTNLDAKINNKLSASLKVNFARLENNNTNGNGNTSSPLAGAVNWAPTTQVRDANGNLTVRDPTSSIKGNPVEYALDDNIVEANTVIANGGFNYEFIKGLSLNIGYGMSYTNAQTKQFAANSLSSNPNASRQSSESIFLQNTNTLNYVKTINSIHQISLTGVFEQQVMQTDRFNTRAGGLTYPAFEYNNITLASSLSGEAYKEKQSIRSYIGRVNYSLKDRYLLTASVRSDGSSKFRGDNKYSTFPSVGLGWRISEESFMDNVTFLDNLKLRGSWGKTGSQAIPVYGTVTTFYTDSYSASTSFLNGTTTPGIIIGNPGNENLKWETTEQFNVGLDIGIIKSRLILELDYFTKKTTDLLLSEPLPGYSGGGSIYRNLGRVDNSGFEFNLNARIIENKDFSWSSNFNASFLTNEVKNLGAREQIFIDPDYGSGLTSVPEMVLIPGYGLANFWGINYLGVWHTGEETEAARYGQVPGDSHFEDLNHDYVINFDDYKIIGSAIPTTLIGWNNTVTYKNFSLNIFFQSMTGFDKWNFTYGAAILGSADARQITHSDILHRWSPTNEKSNIPHFSSTDYPVIQSSRFLEDGSFIRLKNVSLTYNVPYNLIKGINGSVTIGATNLWTLTNYSGTDPEAYSTQGNGDAAQGGDAGAYPNSKTWTFGFNLIF
jgi:TonB-linked SusC/RagA family outer membrane protein